MRYLATFFVTILLFLSADMVWLLFVAKDFYNAQIGFMMSPDPNWAAALLFYLVYNVGLIFFVTLPASSVLNAALRGAAFGFVCYGTYDLTNLAVTKDWPLLITVVDLAWGSLLSAFVASGSRFFWKRFL